MTAGSHQSSTPVSHKRFTPRFITDALGSFDTDASAGDPRPWDIGALRNITSEDDALSMDWAEFGRTWLNPPFDLSLVGLFVQKMVEHDHGTMLLHARTETAWFAPIFDRAHGLFFIQNRVVFLNEDGTPCKIENPKAKHFGKVANSGAPVVLSAFGERDCEILACCGLNGRFVPLIVPRSILATFVGSWREAIAAQFPNGDFRLDDLYRAFASHPKSKTNSNVKEKLRQTLARGGFDRVGRGKYRVAA